MKIEYDSPMYSEIKRPIYRVNRTEFSHHPTNRVKFWVRDERLRWMGALFVGSSALYMARTVLPLVSASILVELNWNKKQMGTALGAFFWGYMTTNFLGGYLSDLIGGEFVITAAGLGWATVNLAFPFMPSIIHDPDMLFYIFVAFRIFLGMCQGFHYPAVASLMSHRVKPDERQFTYSVQSSGAHMGTVLCGSLGSVMMEEYGWRSPFLFIALFGYTWALITRRFLIPKRQRIIEYKFDLEMVQGAIERDITPWRKLFLHPAFWAMLVAHFCHNNCFVILLNWLPTYFHDNYPDAKGWVFNVVPWSVTVPSVIMSGWIGDFLISSKFSPTFVRKLMTTVVLLVSSLFLVLLSVVSYYSVALLCMTVCMACNGFHSSGILLNPQDLAPKFGGAVFGFTNMVGAVPGFLGVYMAGRILDTTKSWAIVFNFTAALNIFGWVLYIVFGTAKRVV